jgi:4-hydroxy 2-oxovalerate aldolase
VIKNLDVTLRDGGYRNNFSFPREYAIAHARESAAAGLEWVEIGYRKGSFKPIEGIGLTGRSDDDYIRAVAAAIGPERVCVILHPHNVTEADIHEMYEAGVRLIRICASSVRPLDPALGLVRLGKAAGLTVAVNFTRASRIEPRHLVRLTGSVADAGADVVYIADSNGSMTPSETSRLITLVRSVSDAAEVGLHAHANLGLALPNAIAAVDAGATWMDSSVLGMGKGPGNLRTEQWLAYLARIGQGDHYDFGRLLALADRLQREIPESVPALPLADLALACFDLSVEDKAKLPIGQAAEIFLAARMLAEEYAAA